MAEIIQNVVWVLSLLYLVWIYSWAKSKLGSAKLAILFAVIVVYLTFFLFPELVWIPVIIFVFATFGVALFSKMHLYKE